MHGEVLLRQCCGLEEGDTHGHIEHPRPGYEYDGSVVVMASLIKSSLEGQL